LSAWKFFDFFNGICGAEKSERSWESIAWELREFSEKIEEKINNLEKVKNRNKNERKSENLNFLEQIGIFKVFFFLIKNFFQFFQNFLLIFYFLVNFVF
jgi:hypothetical protein